MKINQEHIITRQFPINMIGLEQLQFPQINVKLKSWLADKKLPPPHGVLKLTGTTFPLINLLAFKLKSTMNSAISAAETGA